MKNYAKVRKLNIYVIIEHSSSIPTFSTISENCIFHAYMEATFQKLVGGLTEGYRLLDGIMDANEEELLLKTHVNKTTWLEDYASMIEKKKRTMNLLILENQTHLLMDIVEEEFKRQFGIQEDLVQGDLLCKILYMSDNDLQVKSGMAKSLWLEIYNYAVEAHLKAITLKKLTVDTLDKVATI